MNKAFTRGITKEEFVKTLTPRLQKMGWWGKQVIVDKDGKSEIVQLGSPRRLKTIYNTTLRTAYANGHYQAQSENVDSRPYWQYRAIKDLSTRPEHAALDGQIFKFDDPFWQTHYPPNGWNCRCSVNPLTPDELKKSGLKVSKGGGHLKKVKQEVGVDKQTGEVITTQGTSYSFKGRDGKRHTLLPDAGWSYNPGKSQALFDIPSGSRNNTLGVLVADQKNFRDFGLSPLARTPDKLLLPLPPLLPKADTSAQALEQLVTALSIPKKGWRRVETPAGLDDVIIRKEWLGDNDHKLGLMHIVEQGKGNRERFANYILPTLQEPLEVWLTETERLTRTGKKQRIFRRRFIALFKGDKTKQGLAVVDESKDGSLLWTFKSSSPKKNFDTQRQGFLLYRKSGD